MKPKQSGLFLLAILIITNFVTVNAQQNQSRIFGVVFAEREQKPMESAIVSIYKSLDSTLVKTSPSEKDGKFAFNTLEYGSYFLRVKLIGYTSYRSGKLELNDSVKEINIGELKLKSFDQNLKTVSITGKKAFIEQKIDKTVVNVDALISNAGTTAMDVLSKSPGVNVDGNGLISLKGKASVSVFIDDKPTYLSGADLESYLRSLPSFTLEQIELMTNPPAKYDAAGNGGVINIKTKKNKAGGFNGSLNLSLNQGKLTRSNNSLNLNYRKNKINIFGNLSHSLNNSFTDLDLRRIYKNEDNTTKSFFNQNTYFRRNGNTFNAKAGLDFYQNEKTTWGFVFTGSSRTNTQLNKNTSNLLNASQQPDSIIKAENLDLAKFNNIAFNVNYRHKFDDKSGDLTLDLDYLNYDYLTTQSYLNNSFYPDMTLKYADLLTGNLPSGINIYTAKIDYSKPVAKQIKLETGLKSAYTKTDNIADYFISQNNITSPDYGKTNRFIYKENINSAYVNLSSEGKHLSVQAGLRFENTISDGHQLGNPVRRDSVFRRNYNSLFPTVYLSYKLDSAANNQIGLNYGKRVDRPFYRQLNPFYSPLDKFTFYLGNPFLKPAYTQSIELSHTFKSKITTTLSYSWQRDHVNETIQILEGIYYSRPGNIGMGTVKNISINADLSLTKWLSTHLYFELAEVITKTEFYTGYLQTNGVYFRTTPNLQFKISPSWNAEANLLYQSKFSNVQFLMKEVYEFGGAVSKKLSAKSNLKLSATDLFKNRVFVGTINNLASASAGWTNKTDSRNFILTYSYRFGKSFSTPAKHNTTGAEAEKQRVGS